MDYIMIVEQLVNRCKRFLKNMLEAAEVQRARARPCALTLSG